MRMDLYRWLRLALAGAGIALLAACGALPIARERPAGHAVLEFETLPPGVTS